MHVTITPFQQITSIVAICIVWTWPWKQEKKTKEKKKRFVECGGHANVCNVRCAELLGKKKFIQCVRGGGHEKFRY